MIPSISLDLDTYSSRTIYARISSASDLFSPFYLLVIYAPASSARERRFFFDRLLSSPVFSRSDTIPPDRLIIAGDFNYNCHHDDYHRQTSTAWHLMLKEFFFDCIANVDEELPLPTFRRVTSTAPLLITSLPVIPLAHPSYPRRFTNFRRIGLTTLFFCAHYSWTPKTGKGYWRGNPYYTRLKPFRQAFARLLDNLHPSLSSRGSPQLQWDILKSELRRFMQSFGRQHCDWRTKQLRALMSKRNRILRSRLQQLSLPYLCPAWNNKSLTYNRNL